LAFREELVAVVLVGDHDQVDERVSLVGGVADSLGKVEGKRQSDFVARLVACRSGWHWAERTRARARRGV
jgi:hypothetical protein